MSDENNIVLTSNRPDLGEIKIAPEVVEVIIGIAASQVEGVYSMHGSIANSFSKLFGRQDRKQGVKLAAAQNELKVDVNVFLNYGVSVPKVASAIQDKVAQQVLFMTGLKLASVDIHVQGVVPEKVEATVDPNNIFGEEKEDKK